MKSFKRFAILFIFGCYTFTYAQQQPEFLQYTNSKWVDSIMAELSPKERIAQLFMVRAYSNRDYDHKKQILKLIKEDHIGGVLFFQGTAEKQAELMNDYQLVSKVPLLGAIDAEWGLGMRLDNSVSYPYQMALGAIQDNSILFRMGQEVGKQVKRSGLHMNFAPVVDVNNNPANPVINYRSFGELKKNVADKGVAYMKGMQSENLLTTAKHFPGHGDTDTDSHYALPQINHPYKRLDSLEMYPFKQLIKEGISGVMVAHLNIPALDSSGVASTLSKNIITGILKDSLNFKGLVVTDAMDMKGVTIGNEPGVVDRNALLAGNDMLELTEDIPKAIEEIEKAVRDGLISQKQIDESCRKILAAKQWVGLNNYEPIKIDHIENDIHSTEAGFLQEKLTELSLTLLKNENSVLPIRKLKDKKFTSISFGAEEKTAFQEYLELYTEFDHFQVPAEASEAILDSIAEQIENSDHLIIGLHDDSNRPLNALQFSKEVLEMIFRLAEDERSIITVFKNPYVLADIQNIEKSPALIEAYQDSELSEQKSAQLIFGGIGASGKLPVSIGNKFKAGDGLDLKETIRFSYTSPEDAGMNAEILNSGIDSLMTEAMNARAIPGGVVLVAKDEKVVFYKAYGNQKYSDSIKVDRTDLYDLASVTKISSALPALMKLHDEGTFSLDASIDDYLPYFGNSNKTDANFREILTHQARFKPWIPYWQNTLRKNGSYKWNTFKKDSSARFPVKVSEDLWLHRNYQKKIYKAIKKSPLEQKAEYKYSGLVFYLFPEMVEKLSGENFRKYINDNFYEKLGATTLGYRPLEDFDMSRIVPTESDFNFRHESIHGVVHDEGAIMMNGISANAGLFANANDIAKLMQLYVNFGEYGGERFINEATLKEFTKTQFPENDNHRGLGFDKPYLEYNGESSNTAKDASKKSFGHTGFTGTMVWADPEENLVYIFLSNRVLPTRENRRLYDLNTRTQIQQVIYDSIME